MKCRSVACLWPPRGDGIVPPIHSHQVTASAVLEDPPTLYTGGSDGSIVWWHLPRFSASQQSDGQEIWPVAVFCGHTAAITDLEICLPIAGHEEREKTSQVSSTPAGYGAALLSACNDGVLCIWSRSSGHCKLRRKLPLRVGIPVKIKLLPSSPRYVCIVCNCVINSQTAAEAASYETNTSDIQDDNILNRETSLCKDTAKCSVVIVDSYTLNIIKIVFHGSWSIGPVKYMEMVEKFPSVDDKENQLVIVGDVLGKVQLLALLQNCDQQDGNGPRLMQECGLDTEMSFEGNHIAECETKDLSVSGDGKLLALVSRTRCIFKSLTKPNATGEISFADSPFYIDGLTIEEAFFEGGIFLQFDHGADTSGIKNPSEGFLESFLLWCNTGAAVVYTLSEFENTLHFDPVSQIPPVSHPCNGKMSHRFFQLKYILLRIESQCIDTEFQFFWEPRVSAWLICEPPFLLSDDVRKVLQRVRSNNSSKPSSCTMLGEGNFVGNLVGENINTNTGTETYNHSGDCQLLKRWIVTSSLVLSKHCGAPYAVVYGLFSGEIEILRFKMFSKELHSGDNGNALQSCKQKLLGHTDAILCLAAHSVVSSGAASLDQVLISGSKDCTICIWDVDSGSLIAVMHHHVGPVRHIVLAPPWTNAPWGNCFLTVGEDSCVALTSLETMRVERMFPGHPGYPEMVLWDSTKGYIACLCRNMPSSSSLSCSYSSLSLDADHTALYIWDVKTGARERALRGAASLSMFDHFCRSIDVSYVTGNMMSGMKPASSLALPVIEDDSLSLDQDSVNLEKTVATFPEKSKEFQRSVPGFSAIESSPSTLTSGFHDINRHAVICSSSKQNLLQADLSKNEHYLIECVCPVPGIATLVFELPLRDNKNVLENNAIKEKSHVPDIGHGQSLNASSSDYVYAADSSDAVRVSRSHPIDEHAWVRSPEGFLFCFCLSFLHCWGVDRELDKLLMNEISVWRQEHFVVTPGLEGDRGSLTLSFPSQRAILELWRCSSEFCTMRSLVMVSLAQRMTNLSHFSSAASSALAAFYTRNFAEMVPDTVPPLLQLLTSFWQDPSDDVRMAARSLFHCAASRAIPEPLSSDSKKVHQNLSSLRSVVDEDKQPTNDVELTRKDARTGGGCQEEDESEIHMWLESFEMKDWISCVGGSNQDAMASHIIVAGALAVWYPSLVKSCLSTVVVQPLMKLVMAMNDKYSSTAAELLAEGMERTWKECIGPEIPRLITDIFFQIECVSGTSSRNSNLAVAIKETLIETLLPSLAIADIPGFLHVIEKQIWTTASDSPVHLVSLMTLIRVIRGSPKPLAVYLDKVVNFILETMDPANSVMRKICLSSSMAALREVVRAFPMVALNDGPTRLAVGDAVGDIRTATIRVYDVQSVTKVKVLDASGPPGLPTLLGGVPDTTSTISALSFSPDGEGLVAFSEHGLMIRWWSIGTAWWEKLSKSFVPVQCTKLIFVPPWEGFSPNSTRSSVMASITRQDNQSHSEDKLSAMGGVDSLKLLINNLDLFYRLEWVNKRKRKVLLVRHGHELASFQL